jgi:cytoskeleton protein RodZ
MHQLIFSFDGSSWVEVKDAAGRTLFSQMNAKGTTQVIEGHPPFQLVVGNASNVRLQYDEQAVDLRPHTRVEVARLTLE